MPGYRPRDTTCTCGKHFTKITPNHRYCPDCQKSHGLEPSLADCTKCGREFSRRSPRKDTCNMCIARSRSNKFKKPKSDSHSRISFGIEAVHSPAENVWQAMIRKTR